MEHLAQLKVGDLITFWDDIKNVSTSKHNWIIDAWDENEKKHVFVPFGEILLVLSAHVFEDSVFMTVMWQQRILSVALFANVGPSTGLDTERIQCMKIINANDKDEDIFAS